MGSDIDDYRPSWDSKNRCWRDPVISSEQRSYDCSKVSDCGRSHKGIMYTSDDVMDGFEPNDCDGSEDMW
jgi:hypothetical protein